MAMPASIEKLSEVFPSVVGWYKRNSICSNYIHFNGFNLSPNPNVYPLQARIIAYSPEGKTVADFYTKEINYMDNVSVCLDDHFLEKFEGEGMYEVTTFSKTEEGLLHPYYNESWASVVAADGSIEVNYPMLITRGASPSQIDATTLYYPGVTSDQIIHAALLVINHQKFPVNCDVTLYSASGTKSQKIKITVKPKSILRNYFEELFSDAANLFSDGPGMMIFHFEYKLNAYVQTYHARTGYLYGMDHVGIMFAAGDGSNDYLERRKEEIQKNRKCDDVICYCLAVSKGDLSRFKNNGEDIVSTMQSTQAGKICKGCIPDIEEMFNQKAPENIF